jgi:hypothetical protein
MDVRRGVTTLLRKYRVGVDVDVGEWYCVVIMGR